MIERFLEQTHFSSEEDFKKHLKFIIPENFNFAYDVMDEWARVKPDKLALLWTNEKGKEVRSTYKDLKIETDQTASYLQSLGIGRGDKVMLILKRRYEWWLCMLGLHKIGAVAIPATHMLTSKDIEYRNQRASIKAIICVGDEYVLDQVQEAMPESPSVKVLVSVGPSVPKPFHDWHKEWSKAPKFRRPEYVNSNEDTMLIYFTSGTSGEPKMVAHDFLYALGHLTTGKFWHNLNEDSIHLTVADTGWGKAVWGKLYGQWFAGATVFVFDHEKFTAKKILTVMSKYHITSFCAPPTIYRYMILEDFSKYDLSSLKYCTTAGEAMNPSVEDVVFKRTGLHIHEGFGQTETTMTLGTFPWITPKPGSMGKPNPQYDVCLLRTDGKECEDGERGEICINTLNGKPLGLFKGYYRDEAKTREVWHDGFYHTGDMAWRDEEGYYWYVGRIDDVIKSSGYRIGPFEVENALMTHPAVVECAVTGVPDKIRGFVVKATVVLSKEYKPKAGPELVKELQEHVKHETAPYKYPRIIEFVDELPKTISGKIRRVEIREKDNEKTNEEKKNSRQGGQQCSDPK
ncbi:AMP-binding protein [Prevotella cerevisiae]|jgi:acetyl-CoA synthetase|uniref:AMP-binding protein n=1 Tax=Segatella cerevisiae TaxID=2053716 RepID=A0ABT1BYW1_9BACT|nr:AMP-binding protein [Segatella cerevisiae]MCH3995135.1 AMP-binding protein [Prevotella sp.]MCO6026279.1 AMP-binding protein [Segatella cerevisiae]